MRSKLENGGILYKAGLKITSALDPLVEILVPGTWTLCVSNSCQEQDGIEAENGHSIN